MNSRIRQLPEDTLRRLADAVGSARIGTPWPADQVAHTVGGPTWLPEELRAITAAGIDAPALAWTLHMLVAERADARRRWEGVELTWTGPDDVVTETRDTGAVARQLFATATSQLLVATYAIDGGHKAASLLNVLRDRMELAPTLKVRFFVNVHREKNDDRPEDVLVRDYALWFKEEVWPWARRPEVFYDRRAVSRTKGPRSCLHAKCVVQDEARTLITSANLTEAAQLRNIEAGVLVSDPGFARGVIDQFSRLTTRGFLVRLRYDDEIGEEGRA